MQAEKPQEAMLLERTILQSVSSQIAQGIPTSGSAMVSRRNGAPFHVQISPLRSSVLGTPQSVTAIAFIHDPAQKKCSPADTLKIVYGLTPAESRIADLISKGYAPREIANRLGVTFNTVRSQLKTVYAKTNVKRQSELVRLLLK